MTPDKIIQGMKFYRGDCMDLMRETPDNYYELAIVDPPYGINAPQQYKKKWIGGEWDNIPPDIKYFEELNRISKNQIIWGGNYFNNYLSNKKGWVVWDKVSRIDPSDCELAWTSFERADRIFTFSRSNLQGFRNPNRFHPTEKPVALYKWLLKNYAKEGDKIFDSHLGSGSSAIASHYMGFDFTGIELDEEYFNQAMKRIENKTRQQTLI